MEADPTHGLTDDELADLARLADGTLPADRRAAVVARVAASPRLASIVERQGVALDALRGTAGTGAPARLRARVERRRAGATSRRPRRFVLGSAAAVAAAVALALVLVLPGGGPSVAAAAALAHRPPALPAPASIPATPQLLRAEVDHVPFPNYAAKFGWRPVGARRDHLAGRDTITVYYAKRGRTIAYTIVSGDALDPPAGAHSTTRGGVQYRTFRADGRTAVTWERNGRTCILSGQAVGSPELVALADWRGKGAIPF